jgi:K+-transporting ATPase, KdpA
MNDAVLQSIIYIAILIGVSIPLGVYIYKVMTGQKVFLSKVFAPVEKGVYKAMGVRSDEEMPPKKYAFMVFGFSAVGLGIVFLIQIIQNVLPFNPQGMGPVSPDLAFNTAASFITNTNWQAYSGETTLSYFTQSLALTVQNFMSAAVGIAVLFVLIRGFVLKQKSGIGNFWVDLTKVTLYVLIPLSLILAVLLISQGVVQTWGPYKDVTTLQTGATQTIPLGPAAGQIAIKQLGTNGGGFFGANSAFPLENPTPFSNLLQLLSILLIPAALCISFGRAVRDSKQGRTILIVMVVLFAIALSAIIGSEFLASPAFQGVSTSGIMEGKEVMHGVGTSDIWGAATTSASNGSVNSMLDSFTPLAGMILMFLMHIGEVVFGGVGSGLYGMIAFVILTVFIAGLMVGRTPEYLGKKIEPFDMKMVCLIVLTPPLSVLFGTMAALLNPQVSSWLTNSGAHGFSEVLYAFSSMANNNGSAFGGYNANTPFTNILGGVIMLATRYIPMIAAVFLAGNLSKKKIVAASEGTLSTSNALFGGLLIFIILIIGALTFLPALALGPIADFFTAVH